MSGRPSAAVPVRLAVTHPDEKVTHYGHDRAGRPEIMELGEFDAYAAALVDGSVWTFQWY